MRIYSLIVVEFITNNLRDDQQNIKNRKAARMCDRYLAISATSAY